MSKRALKSKASSARAAAAASGFGASSNTAFGINTSQLSHVTEPPDLSSISDPNVVVYFRNLSKKDSTTKAKALEELQTYISSLQEPVEDGILEAWISMYPRASIDNAKAVRQNAHSLQGHIAASAGKRIAKHMPKAVGAWLSGLYDTDRSVVEATQNSLRQVFNTNEKIQNIRRAYQQPILEYCRDAIDNETELTLSDERTVSPDDAAAKYSRVISACLALIGSLLSNLKTEDLSKFESEYEDLLGDKKVWDFASHTDAPIRRSVHRFLKTCVAKRPETIGSILNIISKSFLAEALNSDQTGSAYDYIEALSLITSTYPTVWTEHYKSKTPVERRLRQFLKKGSQSGPREFWVRLVHVFKNLPEEVLPRNGTEAIELLSALHTGIIRKDESRFNLESAYGAYLEIADILSQKLVDADQKKLGKEQVLPIVTQYLEPTPENSDWTVPFNIVPKALAMRFMADVAWEEWPRYADKFKDEMGLSPQQGASDYQDSQRALIEKANRLATLQQHAFNIGLSPPLRSAFAEASALIISYGLSLVRNWKGDPYGVAGAIFQIYTKNKDLLSTNQNLEAELIEFVRDDIPSLILSPSSPHLVDLLYAMADTDAFKGDNLPAFKRVWTATLKAALSAEESPAKATALDSILTSSAIPQSLDLASTDPELQSYVKASAQSALQGATEWATFSRILQLPSNIISPSTTDDILSSMTQSLSLNDQAPSALQGLRQIVKQNPGILKSYLSSKDGSSLLQSLLLASESPNEEIAHEAAAINASIRTLILAASDSKQSIVDVIHAGLRDASLTSVSVETLVDLAKQLVQPTAGVQKDGGPDPEQLVGVFPSVQDWDAALAPFLQSAPRTSLAITNPLGGAVYLVQPRNTDGRRAKQPHDADGYSPAYRMAQYVVKLFKHKDIFQPARLPPELKHHLVRNVVLTAQLTSDNLGLAGANNLWVVYNPEVEAEATAFLSEAHEVPLLGVPSQDAISVAEALNSTVSALTQDLLKIGPNSSAEAYYAARAYSQLIVELVEGHGLTKSQKEDIQDNLKKLYRNKETFALLGFLNAFKEPFSVLKSCERMCSELVADLTGIDISAKAEEGLRQLIVLNSILYGQPVVSESIAKQRIIFFVKHVVPWLEDMETPAPIRAELCRALSSLLPLMSDIYGEHWGHILNALAVSWQKVTELTENGSETDSPIPYVHASLKLYAQLRSLTQSEEPNDDLMDVWKETEQDIAAGLINLLSHPQDFTDESHQPLEIVNDLLSRQITEVSFEHFESTEELYPLLYVESLPVQQTAFNILQKKIPKAQEQVSIEAALQKTTVQLPGELLSLIVEAPTAESWRDATFDRHIPLRLRGYLLSWRLVFDHLEHSSFKVKNDYADHIKEGNYLAGLLDFMFDFLGLTRGKPVDASKLDVTNYVPFEEEKPMRDAQWLLTHLYFLCLLHLPTLTKSWWIGCKSRPVAVNLQSWTEKYVSAPVIDSALESVSKWAHEQDEADPDSPFNVRVHPNGRAIITSYTVDEQVMSMRITLPRAFPLENAAIEGINRVAVNEQKWNSWLHTSLGAITIFNGSLIDALTTFKRNVEGTMKGQTECAICYSIVGSDRRLPDKKCSTCKNSFHGTCLFKWFKTSGASTCPLCRNQFNYG